MRGRRSPETSKRCWASGSSGVRGRSGVHSTSPPESRSGDEIRRVADFERAALRGVALEVVGVDLDPLDRPAGRQPNDGPVVPGTTTTLGLPAIAHVGGAARQDEVVPVAEEHVAAPDDQAAVLERGEIGEDAGLERRIPRRFAVDSQPGHAAVGIDVEPEMGHAPA